MSSKEKCPCINCKYNKGKNKGPLKNDFGYQDYFYCSTYDGYFKESDTSICNRYIPKNTKFKLKHKKRFKEIFKNTFSSIYLGTLLGYLPFFYIYMAQGKILWSLFLFVLDSIIALILTLIVTIFEYKKNDEY